MRGLAGRKRAGRAGTGQESEGAVPARRRERDGGRLPAVQLSGRLVWRCRRAAGRERADRRHGPFSSASPSRAEQQRRSEYRIAPSRQCAAKKTRRIGEKMEILLPKHSSLPVARVRGELQARFPAWGCLACAFFAPHRVAPGSNKRIGRRTCEMFWRAAMVRWPLPFGQWQCHWQTVAFTAARDHVQVLLARVQQVRVRVYAAPLRDWRRHSGWHCLTGRSPGPPGVASTQAAQPKAPTFFPES